MFIDSQVENHRHIWINLGGYMLNTMIEEKEINTDIPHDRNESRLISYYKSDYSFMMESLLIAMRSLKNEIASIDTKGKINIYMAKQYLLVSLDDKNMKWIEVRPNKTLTRLSMKTCNLPLDNTIECHDDFIDIKITQYTQVHALLDFIVESLSRSIIRLR